MHIQIQGSYHNTAPCGFGSGSETMLKNVDCAAGPDPGGGEGELRLSHAQAAGQPGPLRDLRGESHLHLILHQSHPLHGHRLPTGTLPTIISMF